MFWHSNRWDKMTMAVSWYTKVIPRWVGNKVDNPRDCPMAALYTHQEVGPRVEQLYQLIVISLKAEHEFWSWAYQLADVDNIGRGLVQQPIYRSSYSACRASPWSWTRATALSLSIVRCQCKSTTPVLCTILHLRRSLKIMQTDALQCATVSELGNVSVQFSVCTFSSHMCSERNVLVVR